MTSGAVIENSTPTSRRTIGIATPSARPPHKRGPAQTAPRGFPKHQHRLTPGYESETSMSADANREARNPDRYQSGPPVRRGPRCPTRWRSVLECLESRDLLSLTPASISVTATTLDRPGASKSLGVLSLGASASGEAIQSLAGTYTLRPLRTGANSPTHSVIVGPSALQNRRILRYLKRAYDAGEAVGVTMARPAAAVALGRAIGAPDAGKPHSGPRRAALVTFRQTPQGGRTIFSASVLMPRSQAAGTPAMLKTGTQASEAFTRRYLVGIFSGATTISAPPSSGAAIDLLSAADAYQTSIVSDDKRGHAIQIVNTMFSARSFTNQKDLYYVEQEVTVQGSASQPSISATSVNAMLEPIKPPLTLQPSPQSTMDATSITSEVSTTLGGSVGFTQGEGFNATLDASVTITNSKTVTVPPVSITYTGDLPTGDTLWLYATTGPQKIRTSSFFNQWLWQVPFANYEPGATTVTIGSNAINRFQVNGETHGLGAYLDSIVPTPFGDLYQLGNPVVTGVSSATVKPGLTFTIEGQALYPSLIESVLIGGEPLTSSNFRSISDTEIEVVAPNMQGSALPVVVKTSQGYSNANININISN
jgi:IPT/TIG domain